MTYLQLYSSTLTRLIEAKMDDAKFQTKQLLESHFSLLPVEYQIRKQAQIVAPSNVLEAFESKVNKLIEGEPLQYVLGTWEFMGLPFTVGPGVLIPRPETELLVELALRAIEAIPNPTVFDLCAGTGCVGVSIAHFRPDATVILFEKSAEAIQYCTKNVEQNHASNIRVVQWDVFEQEDAFGLADAIVSNPPYIATACLPSLQLQVQSEPKMALDGGMDGLAFYRAIESGWMELLKPQGFLAVEHGEEQGELVAQIFSSTLSELQVHKDLSKNNRIVTGKKK